MEIKSLTSFMKHYFNPFVSAIIMVLLCNCQIKKNNTSLKENEEARILEARALLKEYAFCKCFEYASKDSGFFKSDISIGVYREIAGYYESAYDPIDSLSKITVAGIKPSEIADHMNRKSILLDCFLYFKSAALDSVVKKFDKQIDPSWEDDK